MTKRIFLSLTIITFTLLLYSCKGKSERLINVKNIYKAELEKGVWETDKIFGFDPNIEKYSLTKFVERKFAGNLTSFSDSINFKSSYVAFCGNDNFTTVRGVYEFFDTNKVSISVDSVTYSGEWKKQPEHRNPEDFIFVISKVGETIILIKQK